MIDQIRTLTFVTESNHIEGIETVTDEEIKATRDFVTKNTITIPDLCELVSVYQPGTVLRDRVGLDVRVGGYFPPRGGPAILTQLGEVLEHWDPYWTHVRYELLHPFTDGNGRSGRALWLHRMIKGIGWPRLSFLHTFYYQTLANVEGHPYIDTTVTKPVPRFGASDGST